MTLLDHSRRKSGPNCGQCDAEGVNRESEHTCAACEECYCHYHFGDESSVYCEACLIGDGIKVGLDDPD